VSPEKKFELGDYVEVKDRIALFYELFAGGRLVTDDVTVLTAPDSSQRVLVRALAYRTVDDPHPGVGHSWLSLPGKTPYTNGSEVENAETSAWGRAIGALGILIDRSIATSNEIDSKAGETKQEPPVSVGETETLVGPVTRSGLIVRGSGRNSDLEWRETPEGYHIGFLLEVGDNKPRPQVTVEGPLAVALFAAANMSGPALAGERVEVEGDVYEVRTPGRKMIYRIKASRITTAQWVIPAKPTEVREQAPGAAQREADELGL
jgi:hypothetical protein